MPFHDLVRVTTPTIGTGPISLGSAVAGRFTFTQQGVVDGEWLSYSILDGENGEYSEAGRGVYHAGTNTLTRDLILTSTNGGNAISLSGQAQIFLTPLSQDLDHLDDGVITRDIDGYISHIELEHNKTLTISRDANGYIESVSDPVHVRNIVRDENNRITGWTVI
jgi:hypothetical protein